MNIFHKQAQRPPPSPPPFIRQQNRKTATQYMQMKAQQNRFLVAKVDGGGGPLLWPATRCTSWASHYARGPLFGFRHKALTFFNVRLEFFRQRNGLAILKNYSYKCQIPNPQYDVWIILYITQGKRKFRSNLLYILYSITAFQWALWIWFRIQNIILYSDKRGYGS